MNEPGIILPIGSVIGLFALRITELATRRNIITGKKKETLTLRLFVGCGVVMMCVALAEFFWREPVFSLPLFLVGWGLGIASFVIRRRAIKALGRFWSLHVEIRDEHQFVQDGPFRVVRHPAYFSMIIELLAVPVILQSWFSMAIVPAVFVPILIARIRLEEAALIEKFGHQYLEYRQRTPALFPLKWLHHS